VSADNLCEVILVSVTEWELDYRNLEVLFMGHKTDFTEILLDFLEYLLNNAANLTKTASFSVHLNPHKQFHWKFLLTSPVNK
jgi:hypothetical protein